jgi:hypothetical protein
MHQALILDSSVEKGPLQRRLCHLPLCRNTVSPDRFDTLGIKYRLCVIWILVFETDVSFLRHQDARQVNLNGEQRGILSFGGVRCTNMRTFSNLSLMGTGFCLVTASAIS